MNRDDMDMDDENIHTPTATDLGIEDFDKVKEKPFTIDLKDIWNG